MKIATSEREHANLPALVLQEGAGGLHGLRRRYSKPLYILLTLVRLILAIACPNIANLLLAGATGRRREIALRLSISASRVRLVRQLLTESVLLASLGGIFGILLSVWGIRFLTLVLANGQPRFTVCPALNSHVLAAAAALSVFVGILFGLAPALRSTLVGVVPALKEIRWAQPRSRSGLSISHVFVLTQIGLSLLMLVAAGLFLRTLANLQALDLGINRENFLLFNLNARQAGHRDPEIVSFYDALQKRFQAVAGFQSASLSHNALIADGESGTCLAVPGKPPDERTRFLNVGSAFFTTMQNPISFARLCTAFAMLALLIASVGLYGTMSYNVARRTGEIGIPMALGAQRGVVVWMVLRKVFFLAALGLAISLPTTFATSRLIKSFLFGMKANDPLALTLAVLTLLAGALLAGYAPARRASRIDPVVAPRHE